LYNICVQTDGTSLWYICSLPSDFHTIFSLSGLPLNLGEAAICLTAVKLARRVLFFLFWRFLSSPFLLPSPFSLPISSHVSLKITVFFLAVSFMSFSPSPFLLFRLRLSDSDFLFRFQKKSLKVGSASLLVIVLGARKAWTSG
jgi:hypothetical protein